MTIAAAAAATDGYDVTGLVPRSPRQQCYLAQLELDAVTLWPTEVAARRGWTDRASSGLYNSHPRRAPYLRPAATRPVIEYVFYFRHRLAGLSPTDRPSMLHRSI